MTLIDSIEPVRPLKTKQINSLMQKDLKGNTIFKIGYSYERYIKTKTKPRKRKGINK